MTQEFVTLPCEVVEQALEALKNCTSEYGHRCSRCDSEVDPGEKVASALRAALEQPQNHVPDAGNMVPAGWKLVPVEPTRGMLDAAHKDLVRDAEIDQMLKGIHSAMLAAAPQPPTVNECLTVEQPQSEQPAMTPVARRKLDSMLASGYKISGYSIYHERKHQHGFVTGAGLVGWWKPEGVEYPQPQGEQDPVAKIIGMDEYGPMLLWNRAWTDFPVGTKLYTHPQNLNCKSTRARLATLWGYVKPKPPRQPLTDERIDAIADAMPGGLEGFMNGWGWRQFARAVLEATNNIK